MIPREAAARLRLALGASAILCSLGAASATAQINPFRKYGTVNLTKEDLRLMSGAASKLVQQSSKLGQTETWENPKSGNSGSISLLEVFRKNGMSCQKRRYSIRSTKAADESVYVLDFCRVPSGAWKLV